MVHEALSHIQEARIAVESAIVLAEIVAQTEITQSQSFDQMVTFMHDAVEALTKAESAPGPTAHTIFPSEDAADAHLAGIKPSGNVAYRLARTGDGKWTGAGF